MLIVYEALRCYAQFDEAPELEQRAFLYYEEMLADLERDQLARIVRAGSPGMSIKLEYFPAVGGLNQEAPPLSLNPGELVDVVNYECMPNGGYRRIFGYALFDGQATATQSVPGLDPVKGAAHIQGQCLRDP